MQSVILKHCDSARQACELIDEAHKAFKTTFKRNAKTELAYGQMGEVKVPTHYLSMWVADNNPNGENNSETQWFKSYFEQV